MDHTSTQAASQPVFSAAPPHTKVPELRADSRDELDALQDEVVQLRAALTSRAVIDQAKGVLMARHGISVDSAFRLLSRWSQRRNVKVRVIAETIVAAAARGELWDVVATGHAADPPGGPRADLR